MSAVDVEYLVFTCSACGNRQGHGGRCHACQRQVLAQDWEPVSVQCCADAWPRMPLEGPTHVVKVELREIAGGRQLMVVMSGDLRICLEQLAPPDVLRALGSARQAFFYAEVKDGLVVLGAPARPQDW